MLSTAPLTYIHPRANKAPYTSAKNFKLDIFRSPPFEIPRFKVKKQKRVSQNPPPRSINPQRKRERGETS